MRNSIHVPTDPNALSAWATDFERRYGAPPIAGGDDTFGAATATPPAPTPPAQEAATQPQATPTPPAQGTPAAPGAESAAPAEGQAPSWAQDLLSRMDELTPPQQVDPLAAELFGFEQPAPPSGQPQLTPDQLAAAQAAGLVPQGAPQGVPGAPQAMPGQQAPYPGTNGQPTVLPNGVPGVPGQPDLIGGLPDPGGVVRGFIDERAQQVAETMFRERVTPYIQQQDQQRRRSEAIALTEDYPEFRDPDYANSLVTRAKQWAQQITGSPDLAGEPGWIELCHLASRQLDAAREGQPSGTPGGNGSEVPIEQPGGANPGATSTEADQIGQRIVAASPNQGLSSVWS